MDDQIAIIEKLLRVALDPASSEHEAKSAANLLVNKLRASGVTFEQMRRGLAGVQVAPRVVTVYRGPEGADCRLPWGKHKGRKLCDVFESDPGYVEWLVESADHLPKTLRRAAEELIENA